MEQLNHYQINMLDQMLDQCAEYIYGNLRFDTDFKSSNCVLNNQVLTQIKRVYMQSVFWKINSETYWDNFILPNLERIYRKCKLTCYLDGEMGELCLPVVFYLLAIKNESYAPTNASRVSKVESDYKLWKSSLDKKKLENSGKVKFEPSFYWHHTNPFSQQNMEPFVRKGEFNKFNDVMIDIDNLLKKSVCTKKTNTEEDDELEKFGLNDMGFFANGFISYDTKNSLCTLYDIKESYKELAARCEYARRATLLYDLLVKTHSSTKPVYTMIRLYLVNKYDTELFETTRALLYLRGDIEFQYEYPLMLYCSKNQESNFNPFRDERAPIVSYKIRRKDIAQLSMTKYSKGKIYNSQNFWDICNYLNVNFEFNPKVIFNLFLDKDRLEWLLNTRKRVYQYALKIRSLLRCTENIIGSDREIQHIIDVGRSITSPEIENKFIHNSELDDEEKESAEESDDSIESTEEK